MRLKNIQETMTGLNYDKGLKKAMLRMHDEFKSGTHIADIEDYQLKKTNNFYSLWDSEILVGFFQVEKTSNEATVQISYIDDPYRGKKLFSMFLWYLKSRENISSIRICDHQSTQMKEVLAGMSRFKKFWIKDDQKIPYDPNEVDQYYSYHSPTGWNLVLENAILYEGYPHFNEWPKSGSLLKELYEPFVD